ncbi:MAG: hypothetical protein DRH70_07445, partial [Candidatus Coatesbacteria bacterium]
EVVKVGLPLREENIVDFMRAKRPILDTYIGNYFALKGIDIEALKERMRRTMQCDEAVPGLQTT